MEDKLCRADKFSFEETPTLDVIRQSLVVCAKNIVASIGVEFEAIKDDDDQPNADTLYFKTTIENVEYTVSWYVDSIGYNQFEMSIYYKIK